MSRSWSRTSRRGVTLVEVLVGLVLLGTVLASLLIARGRFVRQWAQADRQLAATRAADAMLSGWLNGPVPNARVPAQGVVDGAPGLVWRTRWVASRDGVASRAAAARISARRASAGGAEPFRADAPGADAFADTLGADALGADIARLELFDARQGATPLVSVDFLLHRFATLPQARPTQTPPPRQGATR